MPNNNYCFSGPSACYADATQGPLLRQRNDRLLPLWRASGAIYPSIYLVANFSNASLAQFVTGGVREAVRCGNLVGGRRVLSYQWSYYHQSLDGRLADGVLAVPEDLQPMQFELSYAAGADGVIMWDCPDAFGHRTNATRRLTLEVVGPAAQRLLLASANCTATRCSGHGRCSSLGGAGAPACRCFAGWSGPACSDKAALP